MAKLLPPNASILEGAIDQLADARFAGIDISRVGQLWSPEDCPADLLPWLGWGLSIDHWNSQWSVAQKRHAISRAVSDQMRKGTRASLRSIIDRYNPLIKIIEWFQSSGELPPYWFRLELPLAADSELQLDEMTVTELLRDIDLVKPLRAHMHAVHRLPANLLVWLLGGARMAGSLRRETLADRAAAVDPRWNNYLETEDGEPIRTESGIAFLELTQCCPSNSLSRQPGSRL